MKIDDVVYYVGRGAHAGGLSGIHRGRIVGVKSKQRHPAFPPPDFDGTVFLDDLAIARTVTMGVDCFSDEATALVQHRKVLIDAIPIVRKRLACLEEELAKLG